MQRESFIQEMKRYLGFSPNDIALLQALGTRLAKHFPELSERFYSQIPHHPNAFRVFTGGDAQIARLKKTLQHWASGLFAGVYDEHYAEDRYQIGYRHVRIGLEQKYVISAMGIVRAFLSECLTSEFPASDERSRYSRALSKILDLDLNLMCESYFHASLENLRALNEQLSRANHDLADACRSKDEFVSQVSHELRTPLNSILGFTKLVLDGFATNREEELGLLRDVYSSAQHLLGMVNDILDIGRLEAGQMSLHIEDVNPKQVIASTLPLISLLAAEKSIQLADETNADELPTVRADEVRMREVLLNLLSNALKFTPATEPGKPHGRVTLRARQPAAAENGHLRFEVLDTGIGIPEGRREAVFDRYVQADKHTRSKFGGSGLGLTISRRLVEIMGGRIGLEPNPETTGTLVWFTLPLAPRREGVGGAETGGTTSVDWK
jgi:signal transduction histidine kinase